MRAGTVLVLALSLMAPVATSACGGTPRCRTSMIDQVANAGRPSPRAALALVLSDGTFSLNKSGWIQGYSANRPDQSITFVSGRDQVRTVRSSSNGQWYPDKIVDC